jgi:hypothetical protein
MNLSKTVTLHEATYSATAIKNGIPNVPNEAEIENMKLLSEKIIDPVRAKFGRVDINSFFRCLNLNLRVSKGKAKRTSQHIRGEAVDLDTPNNEKNLEIFHFIRTELVFDQLLLEYPKADGTPSWIHVSRKFKDNRGEVGVILSGGKKIMYSEYQIGMV